MGKYQQNTNKSTIFRTVVSVVLILAMTASGLLGLTVGNVRLLTGEESIRTIVEQALAVSPADGASDANPPAADSNSTVFNWKNLENQTDSADVTAFSLDFSLGGLQEGLENLVLDIILEVIRSHVDSGKAMDPELLWDFYRRSPSQAFLKEKMVGLVQDMILDRHTVTISQEEMEQLISENADLLGEAFGVEFTPLHEAVCGKLIERSGALEILEQEGLLGLLRWTAEADTQNGPARLQQLEQTQQDLIRLRKIRQTSNLVIPAAVFALCLVLLLLVSPRRLAMGLTGAGTAMTISGLVWSVPLLAGLLRPRVLDSYSAALMDGVLNRSGMLAGVHLLLPLQLVVLAAGLVLLIAGTVRLSGGKKI